MEEVDFLAQDLIGPEAEGPLQRPSVWSDTGLTYLIFRSGAANMKLVGELSTMLRNGANWVTLRVGRENDRGADEDRQAEAEGDQRQRALNSRRAEPEMSSI